MTRLSLSYFETVDARNSYHAIEQTLKNAPIDEIYWFSNQPFGHDPGIPVHWIPLEHPQPGQLFHPWYNQLCLETVPRAVTSDFNLIIHPDGYPVNPEAWSDEFWQYDYIGAPWMHHQEHERVGNGGFSWRSRRLYQALLDWNPSRLESAWPLHQRYLGRRGDDPPDFPEDTCLAVLFRPHLEQHYGIKFAPSDLAHQFSWELYSSDNNSPWRGRSWGFHGKHTAPIYGQEL